MLHHVYILESHADDDWFDPDNATDGICFKNPKNLSQRVSIARAMAEGTSISAGSIVVDSMANDVERAYEARPEKLIVVQDGKIAFQSGIGPYQYSTTKLATFLQEDLTPVAGTAPAAGTPPLCFLASALALALAVLWMQR